MNIRILPSLIASNQEQDNLLSGDCVINPVARSYIDAQLPNTISTELVVAKVTQFHPIDAPVDGNSGLGIAQIALPFKVDIFPFTCEVMANLVHGLLSFINE